MVDDHGLRPIQKLGATPTGVTEYSTATLSDALQKLGMRNRVLDAGLRPLLPFTKMAGTAVTLKLAASEEPASYGRVMALAFEAGKEVAAPILVIEFPKDLVGATVIGSGGAHVMRDQYGFAGCVLEGALRDTDDLKRMRFQVYHRFIHPEYVFGLMKGVSFQEPVLVGGVRISPGDILVGDNDGMVAIPSGELGRVIEAADAILEQERRILSEIAGGRPYLDVAREQQPEAFQGER
ncbi:MAG: hypothetical protein DMG07_11015 [Acidobacteria bacterium]|nr:MAG: hypothetical protein DMG07_11015 [Acidobacteriota bacterium]